MKRPPLFSQFDGEDINGTRYGLGDEIDADTPGAILTILEDQGRIASYKPTMLAVPLAGTEKAVKDMSRAELESAALHAMAARIKDADDDKLRSTIHDARGTVEDEDDDDDDGDERTPYDDLKDKPLGTMKTEDLTIVAENEGVSLADAKTNQDRAKAIEDARKAKTA